MKKLFLLVVTCFSTVFIFAQTTNVRGQLVGESDKKSLPYATISVANAAAPQNYIKKLAADDNGNFSTTLQAGNYIFTFQFVGMNNVTRDVKVENGESQVDLGKIELAESSTELGEISVTAQRPLVKVEIDKLTYSAKDDPESSTSNVLDLLRKVPLVTVDGEDNIQLKGSTNFKIFMNGKPSNMISNNPSQVLKSMPANSIKDVEVITDPGAKYDAEGVGGIINIITDKRVDEGYSGSVGGNGDTFGGYGANAYLSLKYGKLGFTGNGAYFYHNRPTSEVGLTREEMSPNNMLTQKGRQANRGGGLFYNTSLSYELDTLNLFNVSVGQFGGKFRSNFEQDILSKGSRNYSYLINNNSVMEIGSFNISTDYQRSFKKKGEMLTVSYRFERNPNDSEFESKYDNVVGFYYPTGYTMKSLNDAGGIEHTGQVDYVNPISDKHSIEVGLKYIYRDNSSRGENTYYDVADGQWKEDAGRKNDLDHTQRIASGYAGYGFKTGKFGLKLGLRGEHTTQKVHFISVKNEAVVPSNFFDAVPSVAFSYQLGMTKTLRWGYNMRVSRPGIWYLNPYVNDADPNNIRYGNKDLNAEQSHNFNINYGSFAQKVNYNTTLSYSYTPNSITSYVFVDDKGVTHNTYRNIGRNQSVGLSGFVSWTPTSVVRMTLNTNINYTQIQSAEDSKLKNSGFSGRAFGNITFTLPQDFRLSANGGLFSTDIQLQTKQSAFYFYSFSAMKSLFNKKLDISLNVSNPFNKYREFKSTTRGDGFVQENYFLNPMRSFRLSLTYRFGDLKSSVKKVQRTITNEDVLKGGSSQEGAGTGTGGGS
ncbi:MAG: TonB-dependent receptor [Bacteroidia bacterium]|nr:TonB-dependent receptor [Bacteroidia bacterium]